MRILATLSGLFLIVLLLSACTTDDGLPGMSSEPVPVTGTVQGNQSQVATTPSGILTRLAAFLTGRDAMAEISGLTPLAGITVELVRLDSSGAIIEEGLAFDVTDADGSFSFPDPPAPVDSTLMIRTDTLDELRALVSGSVINVSPATEFTTREVLGALDESIALGNFLPQEIAALHALLVTMDVDLDGLDVEQSIIELSTTAGSMFTSMLAAYSAPGADQVLRSRNFSLIEFSTRLRDPGVLGAELGGIDLVAGQGNMNFGAGSDAPVSTGSQLFLGHFLHDLDSVRDLDVEQDEEGGMFGLELSDLLHVVAPDRRLLIADRGEPARSVAGIGAVSGDGRLLIYPMDISARNDSDILSAAGAGLRIATRWEPMAVPPDNSLFDAGGTGTGYHLVRLTHRLAAGAEPGDNRVVLTTTTGSLTFDSSNTEAQVFGDENGDGRVYGDYQSTGLVHSALALDLDTDSLTAPVDNALFDGLYYVIPGSGVQLRDETGVMLGNGIYSEDGGLIAVPTFAGGFEEDMTGAERALLVAMRKADEAPPVSGIYNVVGHTLSLAGGTGVVESAYRYGTITLDGNAVVAGDLFGKRAGLDLASARAEDLSLLTGSGSESVIGGSYLVAIDGAITLNLDIDIDGQPAVVTGTGAVSADGSLIVLATESDDGVGNGRGLLFLVRQPVQPD